MTTVLNYQEVDHRRIHFGFVLGLNTSDYDIKMTQDTANTIYADVPKLRPGFHVGIVSNLRLNDYMDFRFLPGMSFNTRFIHYIDTRDGKKIDDSPQPVPFYPIEFPFVLKFKSDRINNYRPYLLTDITLRYDMGGTKKFVEDEERPRYVRFKPFDYYFSVGFGVDYYFEFFKFSTEIKMAFGQRDVFNHEAHPSHSQVTDPIGQIKSNMVFLSFHFE